MQCKTARMNIAGTITRRIETIEEGIIFSYKDFKPFSDSIEAMAAAFSRLTAKGIIKRFGKGKYYRPKNGAFGEVPLKENQVLESILKKNGNWTGYLTGPVMYNKMGLTTQIANEYIIAAGEFRKPIQIGHVKARFIKAYCDIEEKNIPLLQLLDAIKDFRSIPGTEPISVLKLLKIKLKELSLAEQKKIGRLALNYPPSTRALIGALIELLNNTSPTEKLYKSLNLLSKYKLGISAEILPNRDKWKIE